jgi:cytoskeletal protein RodZ
MNRLTTVRSRRMMVYAMCSVAVILGALGKSMIDGLSAPDINLDNTMVSDTASPALPASSGSTASAAPSAPNQSASKLPSSPPPRLPSATQSVPSASIISRPSTNERSLPDTQPCSAHSRGRNCTESGTRHVAHTSTSHPVRTSSRSTHQTAAHSGTARPQAQPTTSNPVPAAIVWVHTLASDVSNHVAHGDREASEATAAHVHQRDHH